MTECPTNLDVLHSMVDTFKERKKLLAQREAEVRERLKHLASLPECKSYEQKMADVQSESFNPLYAKARRVVNSRPGSSRSARVDNEDGCLYVRRENENRGKRSVRNDRVDSDVRSQFQECNSVRNIRKKHRPVDLFMNGVQSSERRSGIDGKWSRNEDGGRGAGSYSSSPTDERGGMRNRHDVKMQRDDKWSSPSGECRYKRTACMLAYHGVEREPSDRSLSRTTSPSRVSRKVKHLLPPNEDEEDDENSKPMTDLTASRPQSPLESWTSEREIGESVVYDSDFDCVKKIGRHTEGRRCAKDDLSDSDMQANSGTCFRGHTGKNRTSRSLNQERVDGDSGKSGRYSRSRGEREGKSYSSMKRVVPKSTYRDQQYRDTEHGSRIKGKSPTRRDKSRKNVDGDAASDSRQFVEEVSNNFLTHLIKQCLPNNILSKYLDNAHKWTSKMTRDVLETIGEIEVVKKIVCNELDYREQIRKPFLMRQKDKTSLMRNFLWASKIKEGLNNGISMHEIKAKLDMSDSAVNVQSRIIDAIQKANDLLDVSRDSTEETESEVHKQEDDDNPMSRTLINIMEDFLSQDHSLSAPEYIQMNMDKIRPLLCDELVAKKNTEMWARHRSGNRLNDILHSFDRGARTHSRERSPKRERNEMENEKVSSHRHAFRDGCSSDLRSVGDELRTNREQKRTKAKGVDRAAMCSTSSYDDPEAGNRVMFDEPADYRSFGPAHIHDLYKTRKSRNFDPRRY